MELSESDRLILGGVSPFEGLSRPAIEALAAEMERISVAAGASLIRQGTTGDSLYVVLQGRFVAVQARDAETEQVLREMGPRDMFGEVALLAGGERTATVRALESATVAKLSREGLDRLLQAHPDAVRPLTEMISARLRRSQLATYLGKLFGLLDLAALRDLENNVEWVSLASGELLFRQGATADAAYVVVSGRLRVAVEDGQGDERAIAEVGRGETVGEIALLTHGVRSATVYAIRDSELARFSQDAFDRLTVRYPSAMTHMTRLIGTRLQSMTARGARSTRLGDTFAIVPASRGVDLEGFARSLAAAFEANGSTRLIRATDVDEALGREGIALVPADDATGMRVAQWLAEQETRDRYLILLADAEWSGWTDRAVSFADHILEVGRASDDPGTHPVERKMAERWESSRAPRQSLALVHDDGDEEPRGTARWLEARDVQGHHHIRLDRKGDFERLARLLTGNATSIVLGGGGARGFAHIGVLRAMEELGIPVDMLGGTSMGAIIAGLISMGLDWKRTLVGCRGYFRSLFDYTLPVASMLAGGRITRQLRVAFGERDIEDFWVPFFCVSTNLTRAEQLVHRRGRASEAVRASISLPGIMPPVWRDGDLLVDGGLLNNVPADVMRTFCEGGKLIAIDVTPAVDLGARASFEPIVSGWRLAWHRIRGAKNRAGVPGLFSLLNRSTVIASVYSRNRILTEHIADLYMQLDMRGWGMLQFDAIDAIAEEGYRQAIEKLGARLDPTVSEPGLRPVP